jgi:hypothetical protein
MLQRYRTKPEGHSPEQGPGKTLALNRALERPWADRTYKAEENFIFCSRQ